MKAILSILLSVIMISSLSSVYAQESEPIILEQESEPIILEELSPSGQVLVKLQWPEIYPEEISTFKVSFHDPETGELLDGKLVDETFRLAYNVIVTQFDHPVEHYHQNLTTDGTGEFEILFPADHEGMAKVTVELRALNRSSGETIWYDEEVNFSVNVVPEFGVIAMMIMITAFVPILLISKTRLFTKF
jgi:predicted secreted protein with PEFG-CTERM motif